MSKETVLRFEEVSFEHGHNHPILNEADFSLRKGMKGCFDGPERRRQEHHLSAHVRAV